MMADVEKILKPPMNQAPSLETKKENTTNACLDMDAGGLLEGAIDLVDSVASLLGGC
jgi:hypothetical protein